MTDDGEPRLIGFESPYPVAVSQIGPRDWELTAAMTYRGTTQTFTVPVGTTTDLASVPRWLTHLVPTTVEIASSVLHDWLWRYRVPAEEHPDGPVTWRDADGLLRQALLTQDVPMLTRGAVWAGVRWGALAQPGGRRGWWKDAPAVLGISLAVLPMALLPTVIGLPLFRLAELILSPLDVRRRRARP